MRPAGGDEEKKGRREGGRGKWKEKGRERKGRTGQGRAGRVKVPRKSLY